MSFSAWLIPEEKHSGQLQELINRLARENNSPQFATHCTLVRKIMLDSNFSFDEIKIFCNQTNPVSLNVSKIMSEKTLFKSLYIQLKKEKFIVDFQKQLANFFFKREPYRFDPHLSLMYKIVSAEKQKKITVILKQYTHLLYLQFTPMQELLFLHNTKFASLLGIQKQTSHCFEKVWYRD